MALHQTEKAPCPKCRHEMVYVIAIPHPDAPQMQRTTFMCRTCNQTKTYMLSIAMANAYAPDPAPAPA
jgi:transcription elongation factor Elf1